MANTGSRSDAPELLVARWLGTGAALAVAAVGLRIGVYVLTAPFERDLRYVAGCVEGLGIDLALGLVAAAPLLARRRAGSVVAAVASVLLLFANAAGAHFHAMFLHLPTRDTLVFLKDLDVLESSIREHAPVAELLAEVLLPAIASLWVARRVAPRLAPVLHGRRRLAFAAATVSTVALTSIVRTTAVYGQEYYGAVGPVAHVVKKGPFTRVQSGAPPSLDLVAAIQHVIATDNSGPPTDRQYPFCTRPAPITPSAKTGRSALLLILEGVDNRSLELTMDGKAVMPNLRRIEKDGVSFPRFFATGNMSVYALPALFGGIPAVPVRALLLLTPLDRVLGFPGELRREGYDTAYIHGSDLTFSHEDEFVRRVGFENVVPMPKDLPRYGWGASDGAMFAELRAYVERQRARGSKPYFVTAFTVSTHDPYTIPPDHSRKFGGSTVFDRFAESLAYLDDEIGRFYDWFSTNEAPRGTVLVVTGDHAPRLPFPGDPVETTTGEFEYRFRVPLILLGLTPDESRRARENAARTTGGHQDVPATLAAALGVAPPRCHQGRSLLATDIPASRVVPSVAGEGLQFLYAHEGTRRFMLELRTNRLREYDYVSDALFRRDLAPSDARAPQIKEFLHAYEDVMYYAITKDKFAPPPLETQRAVALPGVAAAQRVSRGVTVPGAPADGGVVAELERALADHPDWLELSAAPDGRGHLVVRHWKDPAPALPTDPSHLLVQDTTAQGPPLEDVLTRIGGRAGIFLDVERPDRFADIMNVVHGTAAALARLPGDARVVVESSDEVMLTSILQFSPGTSVAYRITASIDLDQVLSFASERGFSWVCLAEATANPEAIVAAHAHGLRVVTYPGGPFPVPSVPSSELPDARVVTGL